MLRLLQNKLSNRALFFREIIFFVIGLHVFVLALFWGLGLHRHHNERFSVRSQSQLGATVVFMPLQKYVDPKVNAGKKKSAHKKHQSRKVIDYQTYLSKQGYNVIAQGHAPKTQAKAVPKKKKAAPKKKVQKKTVAKKVAKKPVQKKVAKKKAPVAKKVVTPQKKPKTVAKKVPAKKSKATPAKKVDKPVKKAVEKKAVEQSVSVTPEKVIPQAAVAVAGKASQASDIDLDDVTFVGYRELDKLQLQSKIQQAVEAQWSPPVGMPESTACELQVVIEKNGKVSGAKVVTSSKIMAFDLAARSAIYRTRFPQDVWGKQIVVELGI